MLVAVAVALTALTIWYWRYTSPSRRAAGRDTQSWRDSQPFADADAEPAAAEEELPVDRMVPAVARRNGDAPIGLDADQWDVLTKAVMDEYLDS